MTQLLRFTTGLKRLSVLSAGAALALGLVTGCVVPGGGQGTANPRIPTGVPLPPGPVSDRVLATAAQDLGLPQAELSILRVNEETWTDGCLGIGLPNEGCLQALVEGWQLEIVHNNQSWFYRTDAIGENVRQSYLDDNLPPSLSDGVLAMAATDSGLSREQLEIIKAEPRTWDGCLGIEEPGQGCPQARYFGWRVTVIGERQLLVYHTDMIGYQIRLNPQDSAQ
ncbi:MAG: hypothetical protein F6J95_019085 [Leptolyngbya sp. SIO1E4]|nr:hypothetical protein [Leptolyngbya sp. SIO1E4]